MPHPAVDSAHAAVKKLSLALKAHILSGPHSLIELGAAIGRSTNYLSATFRGENPLKMLRSASAPPQSAPEMPEPASCFTLATKRGGSLRKQGENLPLEGGRERGGAALWG